MIVSFSLGFLLGFLTLLAAEGLALLWVLDRLRRSKPGFAVAEPREGRDLEGERAVTYPVNKQGFVWVLEPEKVPKIATDGSPVGVSKEPKKKKNIVEVCPVKKYAKIKDHSLILVDTDGSTTINLLDCTAVAVSASNLSSRKWAKRYPIRLESKESKLYNGSKTCYLYTDTSLEKESWCKALRLASCPDRAKWYWYMQLNEEFHNYLALLNAEYPFFLKPSVFFGEDTDKTNDKTTGSSKVRLFLKKLAKKASTKTGLETKTTSDLSARGEKKIAEKSRGVSSIDAFIKSSQEEKSSSNSLQDLVQPSSPTSSLGSKGQPPISFDGAFDEKFVTDEGTLCWNLLFSRLFFDAKRSDDINNAIKARVQRTLSNMRTPAYIGEITCTGFDLGNLPPYIHKMKILPMDLNEVWAVEVDFEYSGGIILDIVTRLEVREPELQKDMIEKSFETDSSGAVASDLLEGIEHYGNQFKSSGDLAAQIENKDEVDGLRQSKSSSWTSSYMSRWKGILHSFAEQVSQVPLSLAIKVTSVRGTLRLHIKPPPSDQLWYGFTSMPEIDWNLESSVGDRKITSSHIALLISNKFKATLRESLVLPNCESICIPWMLAEKDDWVPRKIAPFIFVNQEPIEMRGLNASTSQSEEAKLKVESSKENKTGPANPLGRKGVPLKTITDVQQIPMEFPAESSSSHGALAGTNEELRIPLIGTNSPQESNSEGREDFPVNSSTRAIVGIEEQSSFGEDMRPKRMGRRARMMDFGKRMGDKLEEKRRHIEEKSRHIVEKMRENART